MNYPVRRVFLVVAVVLSALAGRAGTAWDAVPSDLRARGGLCVVIGGVDDVARLAELVEAGPWVIHGLDSRPDAVARAREALLARGLYGRITLETWASDNLPYTDNLVNLMLVDHSRLPVSQEEILRTLAPHGRALVAQDGKVTHIDKPRPPAMGEWTHPWYDATGSLASHDRALKPPNTFQWIAGPPFPMARRKDSAGVVLSAGGRIFVITQNVPENLGDGSQNYLVARDAFSGVPLWSRPWEGPLSRGHSDAVHEAVVVTADRIFAARDEAVAVLDAVTGNDLSAWSMTATPDKLILSDGILIAQAADGLTGFDTGGGGQLWRHAVDAPWNTVADQGRAFAIIGTRKADGRWLHEVTAVDLRSGKELWRRPFESRHGSNRAVLRIHFAAGGIVCLIERTQLTALSAADGRELWQRESRAESRGGGGMDSRQVGHFFSDGLVWLRQQRASGGRDAPEFWLALDPVTGEVRREIQAIGDQGVTSNVNKISCQPLTATARFVLDSRLATFWDMESGERSGWKFARGSCQVGVVPANGLAYTPPNACGCLDEQFLGFLALAYSTDAGMRKYVPAQPEPGPAHQNTAPGGSPQAAADWPTYRGDVTRGAHTVIPIAGRLQQRWQTGLKSGMTTGDEEWRLQFGPRWTAPVMAEGLVLLAEPQTHQLIALDVENGTERWRFTAGGRISVPPTVYRGLALFGAHDGYIYALRAADGALAWRLRAAPSDRRIMAYGQIESTWPVAGGVLIHEGLAYAAAGRAVNAGGGIMVHALEPSTGLIRWTTRIEDANYGNLDPLVHDGKYIYVMDRQIDPHTGAVTNLEGFRYQQSERGAARMTYPDGLSYLRGGKRGMLENSWTRLAMGLRKGQSTWTWADNIEGELLAFTAEKAYAFQVNAGGEDRSGRSRMWSAPSTSGGGRIEARAPGAAEPAWEMDIPAPAQVEAMLVAGKVVVVAGPQRRNAPENAGFLKVIARDNGAELFELPLTAGPVHDGLAAAGTQLVAVLQNGQVVAYGIE